MANSIMQVSDSTIKLVLSDVGKIFRIYLYEQYIIFFIRNIYNKILGDVVANVNKCN